MGFYILLKQYLRENLAFMKDRSSRSPSASIHHLSERHAGFKQPENSNLNKRLLLPILEDQCSDTIQTDNIIK